MKKCTVCGCKKLEAIEIIDCQVVATEGYVEQSVDSYACSRCGHVELYVRQEDDEEFDD